MQPNACARRRVDNMPAVTVPCQNTLFLFHVVAYDINRTSSSSKSLICMERATSSLHVPRAFWRCDLCCCSCERFLTSLASDAQSRKYLAVKLTIVTHNKTTRYSPESLVCFLSKSCVRLSASFVHSLSHLLSKHWRRQG